MIDITPLTLKNAVWCSKARANTYAPPLQEACSEYKIRATTERLSMFLAQTGHETLSFIHVKEIWGPTPAQEGYEGREDLGNVQVGDGRRYLGRGLIQTTGRSNYVRLRKRLRLRFEGRRVVPDFELYPELLEQPEWAVLSATDFWDRQSLNALADAGDFRKITKRINGAQNGAEDRQRRLVIARAALATQ